MLCLDKYFNMGAINFVKNSKDEDLKDLYELYLKKESVFACQAIGYTLIRHQDSKEAKNYGIGWLLKAIDIYKKNKITKSNSEEDENYYIGTLNLISDIFLPKLSILHSPITDAVEKYIKPDLTIAFECLGYADLSKYCSSDIYLKISVIYYDGLLEKPDYLSAKLWLNKAIAKGLDDSYKPEFIKSYLDELQKYIDKDKDKLIFDY